MEEVGQKMSAIQDVDLVAIQEARQAARHAQAVQEHLARLDEAAVDRIVAAMAAAGQEAAEELARVTVEETGMGVYEHKVFKNRYAVGAVYEAVRRTRTVGVIWHDRERKLLGIAEPVGVVAALVPVTGPVATVFFNSLIALKGRNAIVFAPHPRAVKCSAAAAAMMEAAACAAGAPPGAVQCLEHVSLPATNELLRHPGVSLILGTGGAAMVRAAYSAGKPAIAVGPGNVPAYVDRSAADLRQVARALVDSKSFDNGTPCAAEQSVVADRQSADALKRELRRQGAYFLRPEESVRLAGMLIGPGGAMNPAVAGKSARYLAERAGIRLPEDCRVIVAEAAAVGPEEPYSAEILAPVLAFYSVSDWRAGLERCNELLAFGGLGHTCTVWATAQEVIGAFSVQARAFRVLVNCPGTFGSIGHLAGLTPSFMMGTGTWGGSITSDNVGVGHLINVRRVAYETVPWEGLGRTGS